MNINVELFQWFLNFFDEKTSGGAIKKKIMQNEELPKKLHKPIIRKIDKRKIHPSFIENIWGADIADMRLIISAIDIYNKYAWVIPLKDKTSTTMTNAFQNILDKSN